jgi:hypothetical protein
VRAVDVTLDGNRYRLRTDLRGTAFQVFATAGVRPPSPLAYVGDAPVAEPLPQAGEL